MKKNNARKDESVARPSLKSRNDADVRTAKLALKESGTVEWAKLKKDLNL